MTSDNYDLQLLLLGLHFKNLTYILQILYVYADLNIYFLLYSGQRWMDKDAATSQNSPAIIQVCKTT